MIIQEYKNVEKEYNKAYEEYNKAEREYIDFQRNYADKLLENKNKQIAFYTVNKICKSKYADNILLHNDTLKYIANYQNSRYSKHVYNKKATYIVDKAFEDMINNYTVNNTEIDNICNELANEFINHVLIYLSKKEIKGKLEYKLYKLNNKILKYGLN